MHNKAKPWGGIWLAIRIAVLFCIMAYLNSWATMYELQNSEIWSWFTGTIVTASILCVGFADTVSLIYSIVKNLNTRKKIKSLKLQNGTLEFSDQSEKSYFDQHLDEILYLLSEARNMGESVYRCRSYLIRYYLQLMRQIGFLVWGFVALEKECMSLSVRL